MFLEASTQEEIALYAETYSKYSLEQIALLNKQIRDATDNRLNFGKVLAGLIEQSNRFEDFENSAKLSAIKNRFDLFIKTLIKK